MLSSNPLYYDRSPSPVLCLSDVLQSARSLVSGGLPSVSCDSACVPCMCIMVDCPTAVLQIELPENYQSGRPLIKHSTPVIVVCACFL